ncbi:hypothetical protein L218DRAFT_868820 [Marasmius fiardii PR-910]|nr:hypothetical protein L218DRAFT_868820 [Marasmius fiardii PR-910]
MSTFSQLFPSPLPSRLPGFPSVLPGITPESTETVRAVLHDDYLKYHVFFNERGFHNHIPHHVLAAWALGADKEVIQSIYDHDITFQKPAFESPEPITRDNYNEHLGDEKFYGAYLKYFSDLLQQKDASAVFVEHVFSSAFNFGSKDTAGKNPEMLARFMAGLFHPMIHTGYGFEFNIPGIIAEGLAQAAVHPIEGTVIIPASLFSDSTLEDPLRKLNINGVNGKGMGGTKSLHAFTVLARIMKDETINTSGVPFRQVYKYIMEKWGKTIFDYATEWAHFDLADPKAIEGKLEEVQWASVLMYAIPGFEGEGKNFIADFFTVHLVTSSLFLPPLLSVLPPPFKHLLLRIYFSVSLVWWIARGKRSLDITRFFAGPVPVNAPGKADNSEPMSKINPWFEIIQHSVNHTDDHIVKCQRALVHYATLHGSRKKGEPDFSGTELPGAENIDGTLFLRAALLTAQRVKRGDKDKESWYWDRNGVDL